MAGVLERLLKLAKAGDLRGFAYAAEMHGVKAPTVGLEGSYRRDKLHALAAVTRAKAQIMRAIDEEIEESEEPPPKFGNSK